jgi:SulP family sulfate permease
MENAGFIDRLGRENLCPHIDAALARAREILGLPPVSLVPDAPEALRIEKQHLEAARRELSAALERANRILNEPTPPSPTPPDKKP